MKIGILQTGRPPEEIQPTYGNYDSVFATYLSGRGFTFDSYAVLDGEIPTSPTDADGWLITGSKFGAYEDHPWIPPLEAFLRAAYSAEVPIVGICFGHQILAQALGGTVEKFDGGWAIGPQSYRSDTLGTQDLIAWHQDQVTERPADAQVLASSDFCENAMLAYGSRAFTVQAHPEFTPTFYEDLFRARRNVLPDAIQSAAEAAPMPALTAGTLADRIERFFRTGAVA